MKTKLITAVIFLYCLVSNSVLAGKGPADRSALKGEWKGAYITDAYVNPFSFNVFMENGKWKAAMDIPESNAFDMPYEITFNADEVTFTRNIDSLGIRVSYTGTIKNNVITGTYSYQKKEYKKQGVFQLMLNPSIVSKHQPVPSFEVKLLNDSQQVTDKDFKGKYFLIDFWSTTCKVCMAKRPVLEQANELYKDKFEIVSMALDKESAVMELRKEKFPMLWKNVVLEDTWKATVAKQFEIDKIGLPTTILVSPDGRIVATTDQLTKDNLLKTLSKYLANDKGAK